MEKDELDVANLVLDERKVKVEEDRLLIDKNRAQREQRFFRANLGIVITALISAGTIAAGALQFFYGQKQELTKLQNEVQSRLDDQRLKILEYLTTNREKIFSDDDNVRRQYRTIMITALPRDSLEPVFEQLRQSTPRGDQIWLVGTIAYQWRQAGQGDCSGRDVGRSDGEQPLIEKCNVGFEGRIAVCWNGQEFKNGSNKWCTYKLATPDTCTGGSARGKFYQCTSLIKK
jgi:hypothetical protein